VAVGGHKLDGFAKAEDTEDTNVRADLLTDPTPEPNACLTQQRHLLRVPHTADNAIAEVGAPVPD